MLYLALVWNELDGEINEAAQLAIRRFHRWSAGWRIALAQPGLQVWLRNQPAQTLDRQYLLAGDRGVIIGRLFERSYAHRSDTNDLCPSEVEFGEASSAKIVESEGRCLLSLVWGQYVAVIRDKSTHRTWILRDPTGGVPCQWYGSGGLSVYFERPRDCELLLPLSRGINQHYILGYLLYDSAHGRETGLSGVETVLAGECIEHRGDCRSRTFYWNPIEIARTHPIADPVDAARCTYQSVRASVHGWSSCFHSILLKLSGGLDSSIVLACLADAPGKPRVTCLNEHSAGADSDERKYAKLAALKADCCLIEQERNPSGSFEFMKNVGFAVSPFPALFDFEEARRCYRLFRQIGVDSVFTGFGGDELFYRGGDLPTSVDFAWMRGIGAGLLPAMIDDALIARVSLWSVLKPVARYGIFRARWSFRNTVPDNYRPLMTQAAKAACAEDETFGHPLFNDVRALPPGKLAHAYSLMTHTSRGYTAELADGEPIQLGPLSSQPVIESSLRIPVYILREGGRDRSIARTAFRDAVPDEIISRRTKGGMNTQLKSLIAHNMPLVKEMLLDGYLVRASLLAKAELERVLASELTTSKSYALEILDYLDVEAWVASAKSGRSSQAA